MYFIDPFMYLFLRLLIIDLFGIWALTRPPAQALPAYEFFLD